MSTREPQATYDAVVRPATKEDHHALDPALAALMLAACAGPHVRSATNDTRAASDDGAAAPPTDELEEAIEALRADMSEMRSIEQMAKAAVEASNTVELRRMKRRLELQKIRYEESLVDRDGTIRQLNEQIAFLGKGMREALDRAERADGRSKYREHQIRSERKAHKRDHAALFKALGTDVIPALERVLAQAPDDEAAVPEDVRALAEAGLAAIREAQRERK